MGCIHRETNWSANIGEQQAHSTHKNVVMTIMSQVPFNMKMARNDFFSRIGA
jgi:hypothetical protein